MGLLLWRNHYRVWGCIDYNTVQADLKFTVRGFFRNQFCVVSKESVRRNGQEQRKHLAFVFASESTSPFMVSEVFAEVGSGPTWVCSLLFVLETWKKTAEWGVSWFMLVSHIYCLLCLHFGSALLITSTHPGPGETWPGCCLSLLVIE